MLINWDVSNDYFDLLHCSHTFWLLAPDLKHTASKQVLGMPITFHANSKDFKSLWEWKEQYFSLLSSYHYLGFKGSNFLVYSKLHSKDPLKRKLNPRMGNFIHSFSFWRSHDTEIWSTLLRNCDYMFW